MNLKAGPLVIVTTLAHALTLLTTPTAPRAQTLVTSSGASVSTERPAAPRRPTAIATPRKRPAPPPRRRASATPQPRGAVSGKILGALRAGIHDVQSIADNIGAKPGSVRQGLHGLIKRKQAIRIGRGRFDEAPQANGAAAA